MLVFSNARVIGGFSIFGNIQCGFFGVSHKFKTPIKGYRVKDSLSTNL